MTKQEIIALTSQTARRQSEKKKSRNTNRQDIKIGILFYVAKNNGAHFAIVLLWLPKESVAGQRVNDRPIRLISALLHVCIYRMCAHLTWIPSDWISWNNLIELRAKHQSPHRNDNVIYHIWFTNLWMMLDPVCTRVLCVFPFVLLCYRGWHVFTDAWTTRKICRKYSNQNLKILSMFSSLCE